ncbi:nucleoside deaminase [Halobacillus yeomjeoni]|uniref:Nucleoside deaminase n=1 Tax=Halobacillus yeomjeoni TaxID=311194 RepID=A0A931HVL6_9BACI|nr:nucleoside deaminase [Halobacillus yeomjeoni]MBH0230305.1 nucleoside deaminase [Halobacillus yeomjeoni]
MDHTYFMKKAIQMASDNVSDNSGGPFGAIVVKDGKIIGRGKNEVTKTNDPTAHAEVQAIREACDTLKDFQLTECIIYTSCEPCPMCIGAIYWARPKAVYYACTKEEAKAIGFDDQFIYEEIDLPVGKRRIKMEQIITDNYNEPFRLWDGSTTKKEY